MKAAHSAWVNSSTGPWPCCLESRTPTVPSAAAISTQLPFALLWLDLRQPVNATSTQLPFALLWLDLRQPVNATSTQLPLPPLSLDLRQPVRMCWFMAGVFLSPG